MSKQDKIIELRKDYSQKKTEAVKKAIKHLKRVNQPVNVSSVAREAKVGRDFIYKHPELKDLIAPVVKPAQSVPENHYHNTKSVKNMLACQVTALLSENADLKSQIEELSTQDYKQKYEELLEQYNKLKQDYDLLFKALVDNPQSLDNFGSISANIDKMKQA